MDPMLTVNDEENIPFGDSEFPSERKLTNPSASVKSAYLNHVSICKLGAINMGSEYVGGASFRSSVLIIIVSVTNPQMCRVNARRNVTPVENAMSLGNWSIMNNPTRNMSKYHGVWATSQSAVSTGEMGNPQPTAICDFDLLPKTTHEGFGKSLRYEEVCPIVRPLNQVHLVGSRSRRLRASRGQLVERLPCRRFAASSKPPA